MTHNDFYYTTSDGVKIYGQTWQPDTSATPLRGVVALAHGLGEHSGRYAHVAAYFTERGYATVAADRRGHGKSEGKRGHTPNYEYFLDEVELLLAEAKRRFPALPVFLYGHSHGGNVALSAFFKRRLEVTGMIATSSLLRLAFQPPAYLLALGKLTRSIYPAFSQKNSLDATTLSRDPKVAADYLADPLVHPYVTSATGLGMLEYGEALLNTPTHAHAPLLLVHGTADTVTSAPATETLAQKTTGDVTLRLFEGLRHETHNEPEQLEVLQYIADWMDSKTH